MSKLTESLLKLTARRMDACPLGCTWIPWGTCKNDRRSGSRIRERAKIDARYVYFLRFSGLLTFILSSLTVSRWQIFELISQNRASASDAKCGRSRWEPRDKNKLMNFQIILTPRSFFCYSTHNSPWCLSDQWIEFLHPRWSQSFALCNFQLVERLSSSEWTSFPYPEFATLGFAWNYLCWSKVYRQRKKCAPYANSNLITDRLLLGVKNQFEGRSLEHITWVFKIEINEFTSFQPNFNDFRLRWSQLHQSLIGFVSSEGEFRCPVGWNIEIDVDLDFSKLARFFKRMSHFSPDSAVGLSDDRLFASQRCCLNGCWTLEGIRLRQNMPDSCQSANKVKLSNWIF